MKDKQSPEHLFISSSSRHLFIAMMAIVACCYVFDVVFFGSWAPKHENFAMTAFWWLVFVAVGVGFRTMAIRIGIFLDHAKGEKTSGSKAVLRFIQIGCFLICTLATISFFAVEPERRAAESILTQSETSIEDASISKKDELIDKEITALKAERDQAIAGYQTVINTILDDGEPDDEEDQETVRATNELITQTRGEYRSFIRDKEAEKKSLVGASSENETRGETARLSSNTWAIFDWQSKRTGFKPMDVTDIVMLIISMVIEITATWGVGGFARLMTSFRHNIAQRSIDDRLTRAHQAAELEAGELRAKLMVDDLLRKIRIDHEKDEADRRARDHQHSLELKVQAIEEAAATKLIIKEAEQKAAEMLGEPDPYAPSEPDPFFGEKPKNDGSSRGGESSDMTNNGGGDKAIPVSDGRGES